MTLKQATEIRREQIAQAALDIAAEQGVSGITVKRVAGKVGLAPSALYRHYSGKMEIFAAIMDLIEVKIRAFVTPSLEASDPLAGLENVLWGMSRLLMEHKALPLLFPSEHVWSGSSEFLIKIQGIFAFYTNSIKELVVRAQRCGQLRAGLDPHKVLLLFFGLYMPPAMVSIRMPDVVDFQDQVAFNWKLFVRAVSPGAGEVEDAFQA